jgi:hypothetical protein
MRSGHTPDIAEGRELGNAVVRDLVCTRGPSVRNPARPGVRLGVGCLAKVFVLAETVAQANT